VGSIPLTPFEISPVSQEIFISNRINARIPRLRASPRHGGVGRCVLNFVSSPDSGN